MELCHLLLYKVGRSHSAYQTLNAHENLLDCYLNNFLEENLKEKKWSNISESGENTPTKIGAYTLDINPY